MKKLLYYILILLLLGCRSRSHEYEVPKVQDIPWNGNPATIPAKMRIPNPVASVHAVKGGYIRIYSHQFPRSLNYYLDQFSTTAQIFTMMYETLTFNHPLTLETMPGLASEWKISPDKRTFTFTIDKNAKWSDGKPVTAHDVLFTYNAIMDKKNNTAIFRIGLGRFDAPVLLDDYTIRFHAKDIHWNNFNEVASGFWILPEHYYAGRDFNKQHFEFPVVSGPYRLLESKKSRYVKMVRRGDYWQRAYPFNQGRYNFDHIVFKVFNEETIAFQSFKKGDLDIYPVYMASLWVKDAVGEKFEKNWIAKQRIFNHDPVGFQGWVMNSRRGIFRDKRIRKAMAYLVDRRLMIDKLAFGQYEPTNSYYPDFYPQDRGNPNEIIEFNMEKARMLLYEAGWKLNQDGFLEKNGKLFEFSILDRDRRSERYFTVFLEKAKALGIQARIEVTDLAEWSSRIDSYNFDMTWVAWGGSVFKDPEAQWHSRYARENGQPNLAGIMIPAVDGLVEKQKSVFDVKLRNEIVKKIDQIVYQEFPYVLLWHISNTRLLYWRKFGMPEQPLGKYGSENFALDYWWFDDARQQQLKKAVASGTKLSQYPPQIHWPD